MNAHEPQPTSIESESLRRARRPGFFATSVRRPVGFLVAYVTLILTGVIAYVGIPIQLLPSGLQGTRLQVWVQHPGSSAAENEEKVARILEEQFQTLPGLQDFSSSSRENGVFLRVRFNGAADMNLAKAELRDRVERATPQLPDTVERINIWSHDDGEPPVMWFALLADERTDDMDYLVEHEVQQRLEACDGVSKVTIFGLLNDSIRILLDEEKVKAARLDIGNLIRRLQRDNFAKPLGEITDGGRRFLLRSDMRFEDFEDVGEYPIGGGLRIKDVATVERVKTVRDRLARIDGRDAYYGMVQKESSANVVEVSKNIWKAVHEFENDPKVAGRLKLDALFDQAAFIENSLASLEQTAIWGGGLAVLVLFAFLRRIRMTLCVALSIPTAALLSIAYEYFTGGSFNVLTMTGLTLALGMLVDNAVVVIENIARLRGKGLDGKDAAVAGVRDVGLAIALATLTTVVVFLPLIFMGDNPSMRVMLMALGMPLCTSLLASLFVALVFLPVITARVLGDRPAPIERLAGPLGRVVALPVRGLAQIVGLARYGLHLGLRAAFRVERLALAVLSPLRIPLALGLVGYAGYKLRAIPQLKAMQSEVDHLGMRVAGIQASQSQLVMGAVLAVLAAGLLFFGVPRWKRRRVAAPARPAKLRPQGNSVLAWMIESNHRAMEWTLGHRYLASFLAFAALMTVVVPMGKMTLTAFGAEEDLMELEIDVDIEDNFTLGEASREFARYEDFLDGYRDELGFAHVVVRFSSTGGEVGLRWDDRLDPEVMNAYRERLRREMPRFPGHKLRFSRQQEIDSTTRAYANFQIRGPSAAALERYGDQAIALLEGVPGLADVASPLESSPEQVRLSFDTETAYKYGVTSQAALMNISWALRGVSLPRFQEAGREVPFLMEYDSEKLAGLDTLKDLEIFTEQGVVPLSAFADIQFARGQRQIFRWNGQTTFNIQARLLDPNKQGEIVEAGYAALEGLDLPRGFSLGRDQSVLATQQQETAEMQRALLLSVVLVFLLMGILFESILLPISVLTTIPFAYLGAMWTLYVTGTVMDSVGWIGIIILVGVVVNNGIVLIDKIHRLRVEEGVPRDEAVLRGAAARVRPILMTAMTTVFGLLPMALGDAAREGIDYRALATCVAGGLTVSTLFTLWVVPLAYTVMDDLTHKAHWLGRRSMTLGPLRDEGEDSLAESRPATS